MRERRENDRLFAASERLPIDHGLEPTIDNAAQIRVRSGKRLSIQAGRGSAKAAHFGMTGETGEEVAPTIPRCAEDNRVKFHAAFRDAVEFSRARGRPALSD